MADVGLRLRNERERRGLRRVDVCRATKIYAHHLAALEHGNFDDLPDDGTVRGQVRTYAEYLGLDAAALVSEFLEQRGVDETAADAEPAPEAPLEPASAAGAVESRSESSPEEGPRAGRIAPLSAALGGLAVIAIAVLAWWGLRGGGESVVTPAADPGPVEVALEQRPEALPIVESEARTAAAEETASRPEVAAETPSARVEPQVVPRPDVIPSTSGSSDGPLTIPQYGVGTGVVDRRLVGESDRFSVGTRVSFWTRVRGGASGSAIRHVWMRDGRTIETIPLRLGGSHWRTQSRKTLYPGSTGEWAVEARDEAGNVLARSEFVCVP